MKKKYPVYLTLFSTTCLCLFSLTVIFNYIVDPYQIFSHSLIDITKKPAAQIHVRLSKAYQVSRISPKTIILGTSRSAVGIDPAHPALTKPSYNLSLDGANLYELFRYLVHANQFQSVQQVILSLDFMSMNGQMENKEDFADNRLFPNQQLWQTFQDHLSCLFSSQALKDSYYTISNRFDPSLPSMLPNGQTESLGIQMYQKLHGGHHQTSLTSEKNYLQNVWLSGKDKSYNFVSANSNRITDLQNLLYYCHQNNIDLKIYISPTHARHPVLMDIKGLWSQFEDFKRLLVTQNESIALQLNREPYSIWDFSGFSEYTTEPMPDSNEPHTEMQWYWESAHFKKSLGDIIINTLYHSGTVKPTYACRLMPDTIEQHLTNMRVAKQLYIQNNLQTYHELREITQETS